MNLIKITVMCSLAGFVSLSAMDRAAAPAPASSKVSSFVMAALGAAAFSVITTSPTVQQALERLGVSKGEAQTAIGVLGTLFTFGALGLPEATYLAKWGVIAAIVAKLITSYPGQFFMHKLPLGIGENLVPASELERLASGQVTDQEKSARFNNILIAIALFSTLQRYLVATFPTAVNRLGMTPPAA
jgi:hypothetical protein